MTFVVEVGSGLSNATSLASVEYADDYLSGNAAWTGLDTSEKQAALMTGYQYLQLTYGLRLQGRRTSSTQSCDWPRFDVYDANEYLIASDVVPDGPKRANCEAALRSLTDDLIPDIDEPGVIASESVTVGPIQTSTSYQGGKSQVKKYRKIDLLMAEFLESAFGSVERG